MYPYIKLMYIHKYFTYPAWLTLQAALRIREVTERAGLTLRTPAPVREPTLRTQRTSNFT